MLSQFISIITQFSSTLFEWRKDLFHFVMKSGIIAFLILIAIAVIGFWGVSYISGVMVEWIPLNWAYESSLYIVILMIFWFALCLVVFKYLMLLGLNPLLSALSEKIERMTTNNVEKSYQSENVNLTLRAVRINMRNLMKELFVSLVLFILSFIPGLQVITIPTLFLIQAYFLGFGFMDFYLERHYNMKETIRLVYQNKWAAVMLGGIFMIVFALPIFGVFLAPYLATKTATQYFLKGAKA